MRLILVNDAATLRIFEFERENAEFFRKINFERNPLYYQYNRFTEIIREDLQNQKRDKIYMYLIENDEGEIIGRVNLNHVDRKGRNYARLEVLFGENGFGKGLGTEAISQMIEICKNELRLSRLEATSEATNIAWQIALLKSGFSFAGRYTACVRKGSNFIDEVLFELNF